MAKDILSESSPVAIQADMTEWVRKLDARNFPSPVLTRWGISNSIHMLSVMFYLFPDLKLDRRHRILGSKYPWHPSGDTFSGVCSVDSANVSLQYRANWVGAGRFSLGLDFREFSLKLWPLDTMAKITEYTKEEHFQIPADSWKPGFHQMVSDFLGQRRVLEEFCNLECLRKCIRMAEEIFFYDSEHN